MFNKAHNQLVRRVTSRIDNFELSQPMRTNLLPPFFPFLPSINSLWLMSPFGISNENAQKRITLKFTTLRTTTYCIALSCHRCRRGSSSPCTGSCRNRSHSPTWCSASSTPEKRCRPKPSRTCRLKIACTISGCDDIWKHIVKSFE